MSTVLTDRAALGFVVNRESLPRPTEVFHKKCRVKNAAERDLSKILIVKLGGLKPLIRQMLSPNVEVQCNAVGCVTNLATHGSASNFIFLACRR